MEHKEYKRITGHSSLAILFIHGIVGTPNHFHAFIPLIPQSVSVYNLLLDGHGKGVSDFSHTSMKKWEKQVSAAVEELSQTHKEIYIVAHSMGTLLAIEQARKNKSITKLFLLATPLKLSLKRKMFSNSFKVRFGKIQAEDAEALAAKNCYGIADDKNLFHYLGWLPRLFELFAKIRYTRTMIKDLDTPCVAYQSCKDEMVSVKSRTYLEQNPCITVKELKQSGHYYYPKEDWDFLMKEFTAMLDIVK